MAPDDRDFEAYMTHPVQDAARLLDEESTDAGVSEPVEAADCDDDGLATQPEAEMAPESPVTPAAAVQEESKLVPHGALHEERERRKEALAALEAERAEKAQLLALLQG